MRTYSFQVDVVIQEKPCRDRADSQVQILLSRFEGAVRKIILVAGGGAQLKVDAVVISQKSKEMSLPDGRQLFVETSAKDYFDRVRKRIEKT